MNIVIAVLTAAVFGFIGFGVSGWVLSPLDIDASIITVVQRVAALLFGIGGLQAGWMYSIWRDL